MTGAGAAGTDRGPLSGIRVLDLTWLLPGDFCSMVLADLGAEVIKLEPPPDGAYVRKVWPEYFWVANRGKRSLVVDLKHPDGLAVALELAATVDVVLEGFRPGVLDRLGLSVERLREANPRVVVCSMSGYGQSGPRRDEPGHDVNYLALGGGLAVKGDIAAPPVRPAMPVVDLGTALFSAVAVLAQLRCEEPGAHIDVAMADVAVSLSGVRWGRYLMEGVMPTLEEFPHLAPSNRAYETADGRRIAVGALEDKFWERLCAAVDHAEWVDDERFASGASRIVHHEVLVAELDAVFRSAPLDAWMERLARHDVPASPVNDIPDVLAEPQFAERDLFLRPGPAAESGWRPTQVALPFLVDGRRQGAPVAPPEAGADTDAVLHEVLGFDEERLTALREGGAIA